MKKKVNKQRTLGFELIILKQMFKSNFNHNVQTLNKLLKTRYEIAIVKEASNMKMKMREVVDRKIPAERRMGVWVRKKQRT